MVGVGGSNPLAPTKPFRERTKDSAAMPSPFLLPSFCRLSDSRTGPCPRAPRPLPPLRSQNHGGASRSFPAAPSDLGDGAARNRDLHRPLAGVPLSAAPRRGLDERGRPALRRAG